MTRAARVVLHQPGRERLAKLSGGVPVTQPDALLLHRPDEAFDDGGYHGWDCLQTMHGARSVDGLFSSWVRVSFTPHLDWAQVATAYARLPEVLYAKPNYIFGDGSDVCLAVEQEANAYLFVQGTGDCATGCTERELSGVLTDADGGLTLLGWWNSRDAGGPMPSWVTDRSAACQHRLGFVF